MKGKIAIISDIHEDYISLKKLINFCEINKIDNIVCLGDIIGFSDRFYRYKNTKDSNKCIELINSHCKNVVLGNHDLYALKRIPEYKAGFKYSENWYNLTLNQRIILAKNKIWTYIDDIEPELKCENKQFLLEKSEYIIEEINNKKILLSHYIFPDLSGSMLIKTINYTRFEKHLNFAINLDCKIMFAGHQHPEGALIVKQTNSVFKKAFNLNQSFIDFGGKKIISDNSLVIVPSLANSLRKSGFVLFDTNNFEIEAVSSKKI